ncbi:pseudouridine synthase [Rhodohalobacter sp. SW132]|uniref:pseudouridine synthase n=1 Tax=Rhodohalobacter sp. SW132 TaxID=2293433 RepID=UPI001F33A461|nr:pseudouridine synthase [Rhodohalobacter sp. SW132]
MTDKKKRPSRPSSSSEKEDSFSKKKRRPSGKKKSGVSRQSRRSEGSMKAPKTAPQKQNIAEEMRINKYIAHAGLCSRRDADEYVSAGKVKVNGKTVTELGTKVKKTDSIVVDGQTLTLEPFTYILLNKNSGTITTTDDERDRNTVMDTIEDATGHRVYPVGRLDRKTMGLLLLTNDGDLAHRLMHPSYKVRKIYLVQPNRVLTEEEIIRLREGVDLEDGFAKPDSVVRDKIRGDSIIITVFEGRNHLIRRMVDYIGADVKNLKRIEYAGLQEKDLNVGRWRYLRKDEINNLRKLVKLDTLDFNQPE